jgi:hypothetical protein
LFFDLIALLGAGNLQVIEEKTLGRDLASCYPHQLSESTQGFFLHLGKCGKQWLVKDAARNPRSLKFLRTVTHCSHLMLIRARGSAELYPSPQTNHSQSVRSPLVVIGIAGGRLNQRLAALASVASPRSLSTSALRRVSTGTSQTSKLGFGELQERTIRRPHRTSLVGLLGLALPLLFRLNRQG